jgi:hypothetical protein
VLSEVKFVIENGIKNGIIVFTPFFALCGTYTVMFTVYVAVLQE